MAERRKAGRPPKLEPMGAAVTIRLEPHTQAIVDELARRYGLSRSAVLRQAVHRWALTEQPPLKRAG